MNSSELNGSADMDNYKTLHSLIKLDDYPVLHSLAKIYTTASKLDGRACQMIYRKTDWSLVDYPRLSPQERSLISELGIVLVF